MATTNVSTYPGNYKIVADNGIVTIQAPLTKVTNDFLVIGDTELDGDVQLGDARDDKLDPQGSFINHLLPDSSDQYTIGDSGNTWKWLHVEGFTTWGDGEDYLNTITNTRNVANNRVGGGDPDYDWLYDGLYDSTENRQKASLYVAGGVGIEKDLNVGGHIYGRIEYANTTTYIVFTATNDTTEYNLSFIKKEEPLDDQSLLYIDVEGSQDGLTYNPGLGRITTDRMRVVETDPSISTQTGALTVAGGVGIEGTMTIGGNINPEFDLEQKIGSTSSQWAEAYIHDLYTRLITSTTGTVQIDPAAKVTEIIGDIRVRGTNPIGTAPVASNTLYVTMNGDDTNDGRAMDPSRACRTIGGALKSPYYQPGTQIRVAAGHYLEDNPLQLKPYTSIMGSDIRTTSIEPINKTQDLFHLNSGCYLAFMQFLNGRSGLLEGQYAPGFNRGAYCTAFPPLEGEDRIDLYHSPYVQNCTNLSGPWLKDGTMFVPNETVQVPKAVGVGSWPQGTSTIVVNVSQGTIERGMAVNAGQQDPGFYSARTLMLANKQFLQEQVVAYVDQTFDTAGFEYDETKCSRDTGLIVDSLVTDVLYETTSESTFAGLQYWNQSGYTGLIPNEITTTTAAISYLQTLAVGYANAAGGSSPAATVDSLFTTLVDILENGTAGVTDLIVSNGPESGDSNIIAAAGALLTNKTTMQTDVINWITANYPSYEYDATTCERDVGYIIDSVAFDLLTNGNKQSIKSAVYYYGFSNSQSAIPGEIPQVASAYNFIRRLIPSIVKNEVITDLYQEDVLQDNSNPASTDAAAAVVQANLDVIIGIINNGPSVAGAKEPITNPYTSDTDLQYAAAQLSANREFIRAETIAFINDSIGKFIYDQDKCSRDTGLIVDSIGLDMIQDSTSESIFAGIQYWNQGSYVDAIGDQITTTTAAINYVKSAAIGIATSAASSAEGDIVSARFDDILYCLNTGTVGITDLIVSNGQASTDVNVVAAYEALIAAKETIQEDTITFINSGLSTFTYNTSSCYRDAGLIIDAIALDLAFNGTSQSTFAGLQYWNQGSYTGRIGAELTTTTSAISYVSELAQKVVLGDTSGTRYQTSVAQVTNLTTATSGQAETILTDFYTILYVLNTGTSGITDMIVPSGIDPIDNADVQNAYNLLQANKTYLQAEAIAFVEATKTSGFNYDETLCYRDVGYMIDSVSFDLLYGGNKQAIQSGVYYYGFDETSSAVDGEQPQVLAAYNYIKSLLPNIIKGTAVSAPYSGISQVTGSGGSTIEVEKAETKIDIITNILENGPGVAGSKEPISLERSPEPDVLAAAQLLLDNKEFIAAEVIAYSNTLKDFYYDEDKCFRDVGYMIDSVAFDLLHGGNKQSIKSGVYYYDYSSTTAIPNEIPQTTAAYNFIRNILPSIIKGQLIDTPYQDIEIQDISLNPGTDTEVAILQSKIDIITDIIKNGPGVVDARIPINLTTNESSNMANAYALLSANKEFIKAEVIAYLNTFGSFNYSREFCFRDVGILVENVSYDAAFGGNEKAVESGLAYYDGVVSRIAGQEAQTVGAISYLNSLCQKIIRNQECVNLLAEPTYTQTINTALVGGSIASDSLTSLFNTINTIITGGPDFAPQIYKGTNVDAAFVSAEVLLQANRKFIQEDTINYINNLVQDFPYSERLCRRDTGLIIDSVAFDLKYPTAGYSQSTFAGLQYWNKDTYVGAIDVQLDPTVKAVEYLQELAVKIIQNITPADDLVTRYQSTVTQVTSLEPASDTEVATINSRFDEILEILGGVTTGWTDRIVPNGARTPILSAENAVNLLMANKNYLAHEVTAFVDATNAGFDYDSAKCRRDVGYMVDAVAFDILHGGNRQSIQAGLYYFGFDTVNTTIRNQEIQTSAAFDHLASLAQDVIQNIPVARMQTKVGQVFAEDSAGAFEAYQIAKAISTITNIIATGPTVDYSATAIAMTASSTATVATAYDLLYANKDFLVEEVIAYIDQTYNPNSFNYDEALCFRDVGLIVDAVSQDILLGGNFKSIEAGLAYWNYGVSHVNGQETTTTMALNYAKDIALEIAANRPVTPQTGTITTQIINPFFQYGGDYMPQEAIRRNFNIITTIINDGPLYAPPRYMGGGLFALTGINGADVLNPPRVVSVSTLSEGKYLVGLDIPTIGFGVNSTLYFGDTLTYPMRDSQVEAMSLEYTGNASTWNGRKTDPIGSMGGSLVDGAVISARSPIQSFVYDAFTQLTQGGRGIHIRNDGYAQLVSVFTIFASVGVQVDSGGIASIVNSNANFGDITLLAKGYGTRKFSGQIYNPAFKAFPESPGTDGFNQYYPNGFWPNNGQIAVYIPDTEDRPHISLVMEIEPPEGHENEQGFPGFLNASPTTSTLTTGTITLTDIDTTNVYVGNTVFVRDQYGRTTSTNVDSSGNWIPYVADGTVVTDVGYNKIVLNKALPSGGGELDNPNYFDFYFCGNAYYTVLSSEVISNPRYNVNEDLIPDGVNILSTASTGGDVSQIPAHVDSLQYLNNLVIDVITNTPITALQTATTQVIEPLVQGGADAQTFIDLRFGEIIDIVSAPDIVAAEAVIKPSQRTTDGAVVAGAGSAISLIEQNIEFLADEVSQYVQDTYGSSTFTYDETTCRRDAGYIITGTYYDVALGTNYNSVMSGIAYRRSVSSVVTASELIQTIGAVNFLKGQAQTYLADSSVAVTRSDAGFDEIMNILQEGESAADAITFPSPAGVDSNLEYARDLLIANKEFIKAEILAWIGVQADIAAYPFEPNFTYDSVKCERDVGYIIDAIGYDIMFGSNFRSITAGLAYYRANSADVVGYQKEATLAALQELKTLILASVAAYPLAVTRATAYMNIIINIFTNGTTSAPGFSLPNPTGLSSGSINARRLINSNKTFIKQEIYGWIQEQIDTESGSFTSSFTYDVDACKRDIGYIIDALRYDITYEGNLETIVAARAYFDGATIMLGAGETAPTLEAYAYLKSIISDIAQGVAITVTRPDINTYTQDTSGTPGDTVAASFLQDRIQEIYDTISSGGTLPTEVTPSTAWVDSDLVDAYAALDGDKATIQGNIITFVDDNFVTFTYNKAKCSRDVGYIVDSLCYDIIYGGNSASVLSARAYFEGAVSVLPASETAATAAAFDRMATIINDIVQGNTVTPSTGNTIMQVTALTPATSTEGATLVSLVQIVTDVITAGSLSGLPTVVYPSISWTAPSIQDAVNNYVGQANSMINSMITYINDEFVGGFSFNVDQCQRDVKVILRRLIYDMQSGGRYNSVMCGLSYWARTGTYHKVQLGENVTRTDLFPHNSTVNFYQRSYMSASGYVFEYCGAGTNYGSLPQRGVADPVQSREVVQLDSGKVFFTSTDQNGDFRIGPGLVISQATGVLSGRTFTKSLFANMTPFILAIEAGLG